MSGPNHHHIPVFLQKGFAIRKTGAKRIWVWKSDGEPENGIIKQTGSEDYFYTLSLDRRITALETPLAIDFRAIRDLPIGNLADARKAAACVLHFSSRTAHLRGTLEIGLRQVGEGAAALFDDPENLADLIGMKDQLPTEKFKEMMWQELSQHHDPATLQIPKEVIERIAFAVVREQFAESLEATLPYFRALFQFWLGQSPSVVRDGHNKAVENLLDVDDNPRLAHLAAFEWRVVEAPPEGAILPDCVVLALGDDAKHGPYMHHDRDNARAIVMPLSTQKLLVGVRLGDDLPDLSEINRIAASASHQFFLSASTNPEIEALQPLIATRFSQNIDEMVEEAFKAYLPKPPAAVLPDKASNGESAADPWQFELSLDGWGDEAYGQLAGEKLREIVASLGPLMPIHRLESMVFALDYPAALQKVDRGFDATGPVTTIDKKIATGIANTIAVLREGDVRAVIVFDAGVLYHLLEGSAADAEWALRVIVRQLALVAMKEWIETALPGTQLKPVQGILNSWLYREIDPALSAYVGSKISAGFGDAEECADSCRELLIDALDRIGTEVLPARLDYRYHGDLDLLLSKTLPVIWTILTFAADLLGHCHGNGQSVMDEEGKLAEALKASGLEKWLSIFGADLERFSGRLGAWESFDDFLAFNIHVERLLWQVGMIPWQDGETLRLEVPLESDAAHLLEA